MVFFIPQRARKLKKVQTKNLLKWQKMEFGPNFFREIDLFDFTSFFALDYFNFRNFFFGQDSWNVVVQGDPLQQILTLK